MSKLDSSHIQASSEYSNNFRAAFVGMQQRKYWCAKESNEKQWIRFDFGKVHRFNKYQIQSSANGKDIVTEFKLFSSMDGKNWVTTEHVLDGSSNDVIVTNELPVTIEGRYIKLVPLKWGKFIGLKFDLWGEEVKPSRVEMSYMKKMDESLDYKNAMDDFAKEIIDMKSAFAGDFGFVK